MSTQTLKRPMRAYTRDPRRRKTALNVDLNLPPIRENNEGTSSRCDQLSMPPAVSVLHSAPIDLEAIDDDIVISSPRTFAAARNESRRRTVGTDHNAVTVVLDDDTDLCLVSSGQRGSGKSGHAFSSEKGAEEFTQKSLWDPVVVRKEPVFTCAICMGALVEEHSTICGHIFCKKCIKTAITAQKRCPTCRKGLKMTSIHRVYLPTSS